MTTLRPLWLNALPLKYLKINCYSQVWWTWASSKEVLALQELDELWVVMPWSHKLYQEHSEKEVEPLNVHVTVDGLLNYNIIITDAIFTGAGN